MALFLNTDLNKTTNNPYPGNLIHTYSKKCYSDKKEATQVLMNKVLLPGEIAFAYYYDAISPYGLSALFAVGPLTKGGGNILFKNESELSDIELILRNTISIIDASTSYFQKDITATVNTLKEDLLAEMQQVRFDVYDPLSKYQQRLKTVEDTQKVFNSSVITYILNTLTTDSSINDAKHKELKDFITNVSITLDRKIDNTSTNLKAYIDKIITDGFISNNNSITNNIESNYNSLSDLISYYTKTTDSSIAELKELVDSRYYLLLNDVSTLRTDYNTFVRTDYLVYKHNIAHYIELHFIEPGTEELKTRISALEEEVQTLKNIISELTD